MRAVAAASSQPQVYEPEGDGDAVYERFLSLIATEVTL